MTEVARPDTSRWSGPARVSKGDRPCDGEWRGPDRGEEESLRTWWVQRYGTGGGGQQSRVTSHSVESVDEGRGGGHTEKKQHTCTRAHVRTHTHVYLHPRGGGTVTRYFRLWRVG